MSYKMRMEGADLEFEAGGRPDRPGCGGRERHRASLFLPQGRLRELSRKGARRAAGGRHRRRKPRDRNQRARRAPLLPGTTGKRPADRAAQLAAHRSERPEGLQGDRVPQPAGGPGRLLLHLRFAAGVRAKFAAGQYLEAILPDGQRRPFSMANPPHENDGVQLHIRHMPGGGFTSTVVPPWSRATRCRWNCRRAISIFATRATGRCCSSPAARASRRSSRSSITSSGATSTGPSPCSGVRVSRGPVPAGRGAQMAEAAPMHCATNRSSAIRSKPALARAKGLVHDAVLESFDSRQGLRVYACGAPANGSGGADRVGGPSRAPGRSVLQRFVRRELERYGDAHRGRGAPQTCSVKAC